MKRFLAPLFGLLLASAAHAQSGLLPANQVWAGPPSGGQGFARARALVAADLPALAPGGLSLASGQIMVGQVSGFAGAVALSGDCTIVASGAVTCTKTGGVAFAASATTNALNASNINSGTLAAARGGAGTIAGALKGDGAGVVTQAACADISNASVYCAALAGQMPGTATNDNAAAGNVREYIVSNVVAASSVSLTSSTVANVTSISLTAGDWDVWGVVGFTTTATTTVGFIDAGVTTTTSTMPLISAGGYSSFSQPSSTVPGNLSDPEFALNIAPFRLSLAGTTTVFLTARGVFGASTLKAYGSIRARRR